MKKRPSSARRGYGYRWRQLRRKVVFNSKGKRRVCAICRRRRAVAADHKIPKHRGGRTVRKNLQPACLVCHGRKTRREA